MTSLLTQLVDRRAFAASTAVRIAALIFLSSTLALGFGADVAHAGLSTWTPLVGLAGNDKAPSTDDPEWVRTYQPAALLGGGPLTIYAGTEGAGVWKSVNDGVTWSNFSDGLNSDSLDVYQLYTSDGQVFAVTSGGLWSAPDTTSLSGTWSPLAQDPGPGQLANPQTVISIGSQLLAGTVSAGIYTSADGGKTWQPEPASNGLPEDGLTVWSFSNFASFVWAATTDGIFRSTDSGATWTLSSDGIPESATTLSVFQDTQNPAIYYAETASDGLYRSIDGGTTWQNVDGDDGPEPLDDGLMPTIHAIQEFSGATETRLYVATSDGLWVGTLPNVTIAMGKSLEVPGTIIWRQVTSEGFAVNEPILWALSSFTTVPGTLLAGTQDSGGYSLTFQPAANDGTPADLPSWLASGILPYQVGTTLIGTPGNWSGTPQIDYSYQWQRCTSTNTSSCASIANATDHDYTPVSADVGRYLREQVTASNDFPSFSLIKAYSVVAGPVKAAPGPLPGATQGEAPEITDPDGDISLPNEGDTLAAPPAPNGNPTGGGWYFNPAATTVVYQWMLCDADGDDCAPIAGATGSTYKVTSDDDGLTVAVQVSGENANGINALPLSGATNPIIALPAMELSPPTLTGDAYDGSTLVGEVGTWASPATYWSRQWMVCEPDGSDCSPIAGATSPQYTLTDDDLGMTVELEVTADVVPMDQLPSAVVVDTPPSAVVTEPPGMTPSGNGNPPDNGNQSGNGNPPDNGNQSGSGNSSGSGSNPASGSGSGSGSAGTSGSGGSSGFGGSGSGGSGSGTPGGSPQPMGSPAPAAPAPAVLALKLTNAGRSVTFKLSGPGSVTLQLQRAAKGHRKGSSCVAGSGAHSCTRYVVVATVTRAGLTAAGAKITLPTKVGGHSLQLGVYHVVVTPRALNGTAGKPASLALNLATG